ncbi:cwf18 pre-mRNA splicing factor-domain-containing protein [Jimgerdemannia flammicorona]|uniref:Cwf18 pre-mRNA splicing factor-domain-containing protein n=1 Tax=Jimgerdemannia flammicorona TaxID=994334 RepID=A0A433DJW4_9FUNG|nr:cwf18 pre-mRNA splicing factor-domain-containing protein [Jimgerdemannia flammicorona]
MWRHLPAMEDEAKNRKERLDALRKRKFRNYSTSTDDLKPLTIQGPTVETEVKDITAQVLGEAEKKQSEEVDLFNLAPRKPNWDLKRDVEKKLAKLDRRTQTAIAELIRMRTSFCLVPPIHIVLRFCSCSSRHRMCRITRPFDVPISGIRLQGEPDKTANLAGVVADAVQFQKSVGQELDDDEEE